MNKYIYTISLPVEYHIEVEADTEEEARNQIEDEVSMNSFRIYASTEGKPTITLCSVKEDIPKKYKCLIERRLHKCVEIEAEDPDQAEDFALEVCNDMQDDEFEDYTNDSVVIDVVYENDKESVENEDD